MKQKERISHRFSICIIEYIFEWRLRRIKRCIMGWALRAAKRSAQITRNTFYRYTFFASTPKASCHLKYSDADAQLEFQRAVLAPRWPLCFDNGVNAKIPNGVFIARHAGEICISHRRLFSTTTQMYDAEKCRFCRLDSLTVTYFWPKRLRSIAAAVTFSFYSSEKITFLIKNCLHGSDKSWNLYCFFSIFKSLPLPSK
jgi:hypothetical protein